MSVVPRELQARESSVGSVEHNQPHKGRMHFRKQPLTAANQLTSSEGTSYCTFCNQHHPSFVCISVVDVEARRDVLRKLGRC